MQKYIEWCKMNKTLIKDTAFGVTLLLGHYQGFNLIDSVKSLNETMISVVAKQGFNNKEIERIDKKTDHNAKLILELFKQVSKKQQE